MYRFFVKMTSDHTTFLHFPENKYFTSEFKILYCEHFSWRNWSGTSHVKAALSVFLLHTFLKYKKYTIFFLGKWFMRLGNGDEDKDCKVHSIDIFYLTSFVEREKMHLPPLGFYRRKLKVLFRINLKISWKVDWNLIWAKKVP